MNKYAVVYEETLRRTFIVEANDPDEAIEKMLESKVNLEWKDYVGRDAYISKAANRDGTATENQIAMYELVEG